MATLFKQYPVPASLKRTGSPTNNCWNNPSPGYQRGFHGGSDIKPSVAGKTGEGVYPVRSGKVIFAIKNSPFSGGWGRDYGRQVLIKHTFTYEGKSYTRYSFYAHLSRVYVSTGDSVTINTKIGTLGASGRVTGPHVHFEWHSTRYWKEGVIDPYPRLAAIKKELLSR